MGNYEQLKNAIAQVIKTNGNQEITGQNLQNVLKTMVNTLGANATFAGIAHPTTNPGTPDGSVFYFANEQGTYVNFGGIRLEANSIHLFLYNNSNWEDVDLISGIEIQPIIIEGNVTNMPDEEDITTNANNRLCFKNRNSSNGMGYIILRNGISLTSQLNQTNTIYEIRYNFSIGNTPITLPSNSILRFNGGTISNGQLIGNNTGIENARKASLANVTLTGIWDVEYLEPTWFGAIGNGSADDTDFLRLTLKNSVAINAELFFDNVHKYKVTGPLNYIDGEYKQLDIKIKGSENYTVYAYTLEGRGGIKVERGASLFANARIQGYIKNMFIVGERDLNTFFFNEGEIWSFEFANNIVVNFGAFFNSTTASRVSNIHNNNFLTVYYFAKFNNKNFEATDIVIRDNYINGGEELNDNDCFQFSSWNGSIVSGNFIDYYRTIYNPKKTSIASTRLPSSVHNNYQVFKYFYLQDESVIIDYFSSLNDVFNWTAPTTLGKLSRYTPVSYTSKGNTYNAPEYIARTIESGSIFIKNAYLEGNVGNVIFVDKTVTNYRQARFEVSFIGRMGTYYNKIQFAEGALPIYNSGNFKGNEVVISGIYRTVDSLPNLVGGWSDTINGEIVILNNVKYKATNYYDGSAWKTKWVSLDAGLPNIDHIFGFRQDTNGRPIFYDIRRLNEVPETETLDGVSLLVGEKTYIIALDTVLKPFSLQSVTSGATVISDRSKAITDFKGKENTEAICSTFPGEDNAANYCNTYASSHISAGKWHLPSIGELRVIMQYAEQINYALTHIRGASPMPITNNTVHWSSTELNSGNAYHWGCRDNYASIEGFRGKTQSCYVRPIIVI